MPPHQQATVEENTPFYQLGNSRAQGITKNLGISEHFIGVVWSPGGFFLRDCDRDLKFREERLYDV